MTVAKFRAGDVVRVRTREEILATLDAKGSCDGLPFMPEMFRFCGAEFRVAASAHKTCDTVFHSGGRRMRNSVHLENLRCDGSSHGGCQAGCLLFWNTNWLVGVDDSDARTGDAQRSRSAALVDADQLVRLAWYNDGEASIVRYRCQATELYSATSPLAWWDVRQYWWDWRSGNAGAKEVVVTLVLASFYRFTSLPIGYRASVALYRRVHFWLRGREAPHGAGLVAQGEATPDGRLNLEIGEWVEVRAKSEILATVKGKDNKNRGLSFDVEMARFCGNRFRVASIVKKIVNEQTGEMMSLRNPCIVLTGVVCLAEYSHCRLLCPRKITPYWREIWLKRVPTDAQSCSLVGQVMTDVSE